MTGIQSSIYKCYINDTATIQCDIHHYKDTYLYKPGDSDVK